MLYTLENHAVQPVLSNGAPLFILNNIKLRK